MSECNPACRAKIILNGGRVASEANLFVKLSKQLKEDGIEVTEEESYQAIAVLDVAEDKLIEINNRLLAKTGYKRRTPKATL